MKDDISQGTESGQFTGRHMLAIMLVFFGVIVAVNVTMAWFASRTWTGLVVKNSYVASQNFNEHLRQARKQDARGWKSVLKYKEGRFHFQLTTRSGQAVILQDLRLAIGRPAHELQDIVLPLVHLGDGRYAVSKILAPGNWSVRVTGGRGDRRYRRDHRFNVSQRTGGNND